MTFRRYYEDELAYLHDLGEAFGRANPAIAGLLSRQGTDPDVERLLEGFAFLTGRLRQRLDEELPELSHGLLALLRPQYLRPVPAMTTLCFAADAAGVVTVPKGAGVASRPVEGVACRFRTCSNLDVLPASVSAVQFQAVANAAVLSVTVRLVQGATFGAIAGRTLRLFLNGEQDPRLGARLLRALLVDLEQIELAVGTATWRLPPGALHHGGFDPEEAALPWPSNAFTGHRVLQEYLAFPEKFLFVDLASLPADLRGGGDTLTIAFRFARIPDLPDRITAGNIRLNCVPAINLFAAPANPLSLDPGRMEYRLVPAGPASRYARIYSIDRMEGLIQGRPDALVLPAFESFRHLRPGQPGAFYRSRMRQAILGRGGELWISFVDGGDRPVLPKVDTVSATLTCTDGELSELIPVGGLDQVAVGSPAAMSFRNVTPVTPEASPPLEGDTMWRLVAGLARSMSPLIDIESLRSLIASYDFRAIHDEQQRRRLELQVSGLLDLGMEPMERLVKGIPLLGRQLTVTVKESGFGGAEGAFLFGAAFEAFMGAYAGLNSCYRLVMHCAESKVRFAWPVRAGAAAVL